MTRTDTIATSTLRARIVGHLLVVGEASPVQLADVLGERIGNVAYHVRVLREARVLLLARELRVRGAVEHRYRLNLPLAREQVRGAIEHAQAVLDALAAATIDDEREVTTA